MTEVGKAQPPVLNIDLHTHSQASDGALSPTELVNVAAQAQLRFLALTDHDTINGIAEATQQADYHGLTLVAGCEFSTLRGRHCLHVLGLGINPNNPNLVQQLDEVHALRAARISRIINGLDYLKLPDLQQSVMARVGKGTAGRLHVAQELVARNMAKDIRQAFKRYLKPGTSGYAVTEWPELTKTISIIRAAGGIAVLAHPGRCGFTRKRMLRLLAEFKEAGGQGIEVITPCHSRDEQFAYARIAQETELLASAGSDYHGPLKGHIRLGVLPPLPVGCTPVWGEHGLQLAV